MNQRPTKEEYYLDIAKAVCKRSTCLRRHYGAVIVKDDRIISTGYNGAARGDVNCCDKGTCIREEQNIPHGCNYELCEAVHAEANAIINGNPSDMIGSTLYLYGEDSNGKQIEAKPCKMCERLIRNARIENVIQVTHVPTLDYGEFIIKEILKEDPADYKLTKNESGVISIMFDGKVIGIIESHQNDKKSNRVSMTLSMDIGTINNELVYNPIYTIDLNTSNMIYSIHKDNALLDFLEMYFKHTNDNERLNTIKRYDQTYIRFNLDSDECRFALGGIPLTDDVIKIVQEFEQKVGYPFLRHLDVKHAVIDDGLIHAYLYAVECGVDEWYQPLNDRTIKRPTVEFTESDDYIYLQQQQVYHKTVSERIYECCRRYNEVKHGDEIEAATAIGLMAMAKKEKACDNHKEEN